MHKHMLEDILDRIQSPLSINRIDVRYKICDFIKQRHVERKRELLSMQNMGKGSHKVFKYVVNELL